MENRKTIKNNPWKKLNGSRQLKIASAISNTWTSENKILIMHPLSWVNLITKDSDLRPFEK